MKIYTLVESKAQDYGTIHIDVRLIMSTLSLNEAQDKLKDVAKDYFYDYLYVNENEEYMEVCETDPRMEDFEQMYQFYLAGDKMSWGVNEWNGICIEFTIVESEINME